MNIWDYGVKYPYGFSKEYGTTFHTGEDWTVTDFRTDVPVTVNGHVIGIAGTTGRSTGLHLHVGKWAGAKHYPPLGGGKTLGNDAVVTQVDTVGKTDNGKFVRINSGGFDWVYLHLDSVNVKVGDKLQRKVDDMVDEEDVYRKFQAFRGRQPSQAEVDKFAGHYTHKQLDKILDSGSERDKIKHLIALGTLADKDDWKGRLEKQSSDPAEKKLDAIKKVLES